MADIQAGSTVTIRRTMKDETGVVIDISGATTKTFYLRLPHTGKVLTLQSNFTTNGTDGKHEIVTALLNAPGLWILQAKLIVSGQPFWSEKQTISVRENTAP